MNSGLKSPARATTISKISTDTLECQRKIQSYLNRGPASLMRLKEHLPLLFDSHRMWTREGQAQLLRSCSLQPVFLTTPFHHVTFAMETAPASEPSRPS